MCEETNEAVVEIKVTYMTVQKRHSIRFHIQSKNLDAGTVVRETKINHPVYYDFYLTSHTGRLGTSRPRHYFVLYDENDLTSNELLTLTHHLCYNYGRATCAVSVVPAIYYADLIAKRGALYIDQDNLSRISSQEELAVDDRYYIQIL